jgi:hypothetical protein
LIRVLKYVCAVVVWLILASLVDLFLRPIFNWHMQLETAVRLELMIVAALFILCMLGARLIKHRERERPQAAPDPRKWRFDPDTGEYSRITGRFRGRIIYSQTDTHEKRWFDEFHRIVILRTGLVCLIVGAFVFYGALLYADEHPQIGGPLIVMVLSGVFVLIGGSMAIMGIPRHRGDRIGPEPIPPPGREEVERQKVHGEGRLMTREEMDRALRGNAQSGQKQTFED